MINYAHSTDVYQIWADMVASDRRILPYDPSNDHYCVYYGRRDGRNYAHGHEEVMARYGNCMAMQGRMPDALSNDLGNIMYMIHARTKSEVEEFKAYMAET